MNTVPSNSKNSKTLEDTLYSFKMSVSNSPVTWHYIPEEKSPLLLLFWKHVTDIIFSISLSFSPTQPLNMLMTYDMS